MVMRDVYASGRAPCNSRPVASDDDLLGKTNKLFSKLGSGLRKVGRATTGVGLGDLRIVLADRSGVFRPGDEVRGKLELALADASDARRLMVGLRATQKSISYGKGPSGIRTATSNTVELYRFDREVGGPRSYHADVVEFALPVPPDALDHGVKLPDGTTVDSRGRSASSRIGDVARAVSSVVSPATSPVHWQIVAWLDLPWSQNVKAAVDVVIKKA
jgi:hypothetical protein